MKILNTKTTIQKAMRNIFYLLLCVVLLTSCVKHKTYDEETILLLTQDAFLRGYKAALLEQHYDSAWSNVKSKYKFH